MYDSLQIRASDPPEFSVANLLDELVEDNRRMTHGQYGHFLSRWVKSMSTYCNLRHSSTISHAIYSSPRALFEGLQLLDSKTIQPLLQLIGSYTGPSYDFSERFEVKLTGLRMPEILSWYRRTNGQPLSNAEELAMALDLFTRQLTLVLYRNQLSFFRVHIAEMRPIGRELVKPVQVRMVQILFMLQDLRGGARSSASLVNQAGPFKTLHLHSLLCEIRACLFDVSTEEHSIMKAWEVAKLLKQRGADLRRAPQRSQRTTRTAAPAASPAAAPAAAPAATAPAHASIPRLQVPTTTREVWLCAVQSKTFTKDTLIGFLRTLGGLPTSKSQTRSKIEHMLADVLTQHRDEGTLEVMRAIVAQLPRSRAFLEAVAAHMHNN